ncbi:MAG: ABC transporter ATP-binding protein [Clostridia bacterium]|nr:ABC transporter ATP-binding protein [Clostridia bacterium]MBR0443919.1 ABC transporter ATP-binding protein [Clostridia bacterium]
MILMKNISKTFYVGDEIVRALQDVSLHIRPNEFVAVCGPSGSGKTTLMNIMGCLDNADSGTYLLDGVDVAECNDRQLSDIRSLKIGFIFQQFNLLDQMNALENVELPLIYQKVGVRERIERAKEALDLVGLSNRIHHKPSQLSGGQQQRVAIARALASNARVILADEPTGNLDSKSGEDVMNLIGNLTEKNCTVVLITHNPDVAKMAHRTIYVHDGRIYQEKEGII